MYQKMTLDNNREAIDTSPKRRSGHHISLATTSQAGCDTLASFDPEMHENPAISLAEIFDASGENEFYPETHLSAGNTLASQKSVQGPKRRRITHSSETLPTESWNIWSGPNLHHLQQLPTDRSLSPLSRLLLDNTATVSIHSHTAGPPILNDPYSVSKYADFPYLYNNQELGNLQSLTEGTEGHNLHDLFLTSDKSCYNSISVDEFIDENSIMPMDQCSSSNSSSTNENEPNIQPIAIAAQPPASSPPSCIGHETGFSMSDNATRGIKMTANKDMPMDIVPERHLAAPGNYITGLSPAYVCESRHSETLYYATQSRYDQVAAPPNELNREFDISNYYYEGGDLDPNIHTPIAPNYSGRENNGQASIRSGKRGPFKDPLLRKQTAQTRKRGSCIRCRMQRIRCEANEDEPDGPCLTCKRVTGIKAGRFPCLRYKITDVMLYKQGQVPGYEWTQRWNNSISDPIQRWASPEIKTITICEGYSNNGVQFRVRQFVPEEGDKLERTWDYNGQKMAVRVPPYALIDMEEGRDVYERYISECMDDAFMSILGPPDGMLSRTYQQAVDLSRRHDTLPNTLDLLNLTMRLWMSVRLSTKTTFIIGKEKLGMRHDILDITNPTPGKIPIPPVFGAQLDVILIHHIQSKLRRKLLDKLQDTIFQNKQGNWFVMYLVKFILLHNTALIIEHDMNYAKKHGMKRRFAREHKVQEYHLGANILLAHFHYCNKGMYPFSEKCKDQELRHLAQLSEAQMHFVYKSREFIKRHETSWLHLRQRHEYENPWFYVSQLYETDWRPSKMVI
ncbi:hypothetical protein VHEMI06276 [[Torrubiella] hemipterigena]|uniref:Zn(2)-C6 fungal-type domain-containing protein n=1 Tax=[Torrubiella] hemipterigena TaxID=1531966 RepID=A0A0A1TIP5_9HYPO|nr:hypothetical protein VHEMI06276 [[Torrubiella] hemipterigena]